MKPSEELLRPCVLWLLGVLVFQVSDQPGWKRQRVQEFDAVLPNGLSNSQPAKMSQGSWRFWKKDRKRDADWLLAPGRGFVSLTPGLWEAPDPCGWLREEMP